MSLSSLSSLSDEEMTTTRRVIQEKLNAFDTYNEEQFQFRFRLKKETVLHLSSLLGDKIEPITNRSRSIKTRDQLLIALRYFATGSYQTVIGDVFHVEQPTVHRIVHRVSAELAKLKNIYIKMPDVEEQRQIATDFYAIARFPRVIGAVDCTHVRIKSPGGPQAETFRNRKGYFSLNVQAVCDANLRIRNIIARWPGSVHDSTIFNDSPLCAHLERGDYGHMCLLGDSGYPCRRYLLTPLLNPHTPAEEGYNRAHTRTRNTVERVFGILKRRFPCLQVGLQVKIENVPPIIVACAVLHNIAINQNDIMEDIIIENESTESFPPAPHNTTNENFATRNNIINTYFTTYNCIFIVFSSTFKGKAIG